MLDQQVMHSTLVDLSSARHLADWTSWQQLTAKAPPFLTPEFFTLASRFAGDDAFVAEAWDGDRMIGALPLGRSGDRLVSLTCDYTPGYDYYGTPEGVEAIWRSLRADPSWNQLVIGKVPVESLLASRLPTLANADGCPVVVRLESGHPYFALRGFEAEMSPKFRSNLSRCARHAGDLTLEKIAVPDRAAFDEALAIEAMAWKGAAGTSIAADPRAAHLYHTLLRLFGRRGRGTLYFLRQGGRRIAMLLAIEDDRTLYALKIGYDPSASRLSPGHLMVWKVAADAEARGLEQFDFVGHDDPWKRKWTDRVHESVGITIYRDTLAGLGRYALHLARPHIPTALRGGLREALPRGCQRNDIVGAHTLVARVRGRLDQGLGIKSGIRRIVRPPPVRDPLGQPSQFAPGSWVRVKSAPAVRELLDQRDRTRGLLFTQAQWDTADQVFQVAKQVRRMRDDHGRFRPISRTVLLEGVDCAGHSTEPAGCGRHCPMMYRDEWLEPAGAPERGPTQPSTARHARIRSLEEIRAGLDLRGRQDGLTFMPEMAQYAGRRVPIANKITSVFEYDRWIATRAPIYVLEGLHCAGDVVGDKGPCDRACSLLWHEAWLIVEPVTGPCENAPVR
ncbi:MAG TPA: GNAT family N-acetyltransferase [Kofleriaceae bacterium]|nr:GNAT family N-acetyltransferase [Kofleriaceae bacterium]